MSVPTGTKRGIAYIPAEMESLMRDKLWEVNPLIAKAPLSAIIRYLIAREALGPDDAAEYLYKTPRNSRKIPA